MDSLNPSPETGQTTSLGQVDRYELHRELADTAAGMLYAARDTVAGTAVSLLFLPAALSAKPKALDLLRPQLAAVARFRHPGVAHLLHLTQVWEIDAAARAETGTESGAAVLVSDLPAGVSLPEWRQQFPGGQAPVADVLDVVWELAEALDGLHAEGIVHGALMEESIVMTPRVPVLLGAAVELRVRAALAELGLGTPLPEGALQDERSDFLALARLVPLLLPNPPNAAWEHVLDRAMGSGAEIGFESARQFAGALRAAVEDAPPASPPEPVLPQPGPAPAALPPEPAPHRTPAVVFESSSAADEPAPPASRWINIAIVIAALAAVALAVGLILSRRNQPPPPEPEATLPWEPIKQSTHLSPTFAWRVTLPAVTEGQSLRLRLYGQTRILAAVASVDGIAIQETAGKQQTTELSRATVDGWAAGDVLAVVKAPDSLTVYRNGVRLTGVPCPLEQWRMARWDGLGGIVPTGLSYQKIGRLVFADDFMHGENELGEWQPESGEWTVHAIRNPIRSANPFSFLGKGSNAVAKAGHWFWRNYTLACSAHPLPGSSFGLSICRQDAANAYDLRWTGGGTPTLELVRVCGGQRQSLAKKALPFQPNAWVRLQASQLDGVLVVSVDDHEVFRVDDRAPLLGGGVALWTDGGEGTVFDDVTVGPVDRLAVTPDLQIPISLLPTARLGTTTALPECALGEVILENASVEATADLAGRTAPAGLFARRNGPRQLRFELVPGTPWQARILAVTPVGENVVASQELAAPTGTTTLGFTVLNREAWGMVDGRIAVYAGQIPVLGRGHCGAFATPEAPLELTTLSVAPAVALPNIDNRVETFTHEQSMQNWNSPVLAWTPDYSSSVPLYWHRSDFWRDVAATADIAELERVDGAQTWGVSLATEGDTDGSAKHRWELYLTPEAKELSVRCPGQDPTAVPAGKSIHSLALERLGNRLLAKANGRVVWHETLPPEGEGLMRVGRIGRGATDEWAQAVAIRADSVRTYSFKEAPVDWLPACGEWKVTNRWQCDPRWSFFSGVQMGNPACLWNKRQHGENVTIEFFVGPKMDRSRGKWYEYAADFNAVICADGQDISSGYSFMFGGWDDRGSQIVRQHQILAENRRIVIPRKSSTHRRWFHVKLRKRGKQLTFWVDGALVGSVRDENVLPGNRFGLWTWNNGIMVAQVRVATDSEMPSVGMETPPKSRPNIPYDKQ
jgi:hypothetical protein